MSATSSSTPPPARWASPACRRTGLDWAALAAAAATADGVIDHADGTLGLAAQLDFDQGEATFPFGAHIAVVEVDQDTGKVTLLRHIAVDDCGTVLNPLLVEGQQHGGVAAGVSQTLYEQVVYDDDGNPLTGNFMDYAIPSAAEFPSFEVHSTETPTPLNPLGAKGIGEASTIGSTPAVQNAVIDARRPSRRAPHRSAVHQPARCGRPSATPRQARSPTHGSSRRRSSADWPPAKRSTKRASTPPKESDGTFIPLYTGKCVISTHTSHVQMTHFDFGHVWVRWWDA